MSHPPFVHDVIAALRAGQRNVVLVAPPGVGKTTRVPVGLLQSDVVQPGEILVLEPRRIAARMAAAFVAQQLGEQVGSTVGYRVRFDARVSSDTRITYMTEGVLTRRLLSDPQLEGVGCVMFDEFHERHITTDVGLVLLRQLQATTRPDLRLVVMSATMAGDEVARYFGDAALVVAEGVAHPVTAEHVPVPQGAHTEREVAKAIVRALREHQGDVLAFLPGVAEIRRAHEALGAPAGVEVLELYGSQQPHEQDRALRPSPNRRVILATNVAETSVTIEGVRVVVDTGLARRAGYDAARGIPTLELRPVSQASVAQRTGRAGRVAPGHAVRLFSAHDLSTRPAGDVPELCRADLSETLLWLWGLGVPNAAHLPWLDAPPLAAWNEAAALLETLGLAAGGTLTPLGRAALELPFPPRLSRVLLELRARGAPEAGAWLVALLQEGLPRARGTTNVVGTSDHATVLDALRGGRRAEQADLGITPEWRKRVQRQARTLGGGKAPPEVDDQILALGLLAGFPERLARRQGPERVQLAGGGQATVARESVVRNHAGELAVVTEVEARQQGAHRQVLARGITLVQPDWVLELFADRIEERNEVAWKDGGRPELWSRLLFGGVVLWEERRMADPEDVRQAVLNEIRKRGITSVIDADAWAAWLARYRLVHAALPTTNWPEPSEAWALSVLEHIVPPCRSLSEARAADLCGALHHLLPPEAQRLASQRFPSDITLGHGKRLRVHYEPNRDPWVESYLQDFFGLAATPTVGHGTPLTVHLWAPNRRPVQVTRDLASFWREHYPELRRSLSRRYPRHAWPEDPLSATPPAKPPRRAR